MLDAATGVEVQAMDWIDEWRDATGEVLPSLGALEGDVLWVAWSPDCMLFSVMSLLCSAPLISKVAEGPSAPCVDPLTQLHRLLWAVPARSLEQGVGASQEHPAMVGGQG